MQLSAHSWRRAATIAAITATSALVSGALAAQSTVPVADEFEKLHFRSIGPAIMSGQIGRANV